jgi:hypothetical protein
VQQRGRDAAEENPGSPAVAARPDGDKRGVRSLDFLEQASRGLSGKLATTGRIHLFDGALEAFASRGLKLFEHVAHRKSGVNRGVDLRDSRETQSSGRRAETIGLPSGLERLRGPVDAAHDAVEDGLCRRRLDAHRCWLLDAKNTNTTNSSVKKRVVESPATNHDQPCVKSSMSNLLLASILAVV